MTGIELAFRSMEQIPDQCAVLGLSIASREKRLFRKGGGFKRCRKGDGLLNSQSLRRRQFMEYAMLMINSSFAVSTPNGLMGDEIPTPIRQELNADRDHDLLVRMRDLARKKRMRQPHITDEEMADYLALAENYQNFAQWLSARAGALQKPPRSSVAWIAVTVVTVGFLTAMLIVAIAIAA